MVAHTLRFVASIAAGARYAGTLHPDSPASALFRDAEKMGLDQNPRKTTLTLS